jgi:Tfp pilus assembly protein PilN
MKAVNLLPREAQRSFSSIRGLGTGTTALMAALGLAFVVAVGYVVVANSVTSKKDELAKVNVLQASSDQQANKLKPYSDLEAARVALVQRVESLTGGRYDWPETLDRVARALPANAKLTTLNGSAASSTAGPSIALNGCTPSHDAVANVIDRLRAVKGVDAVTLQSSTIAPKSGASASGGDDCPGAETFQMTLQLTGTGTGTAAATTTAPAAPGTATTSTTPAAPATTSTTNAAPAGGS